MARTQVVERSRDRQLWDRYGPGPEVRAGRAAGSVAGVLLGLTLQALKVAWLWMCRHPWVTTICGSLIAAGLMWGWIGVALVALGWLGPSLALVAHLIGRRSDAAPSSSPQPGRWPTSAGGQPGSGQPVGGDGPQVMEVGELLGRRVDRRQRRRFVDSKQQLLEEDRMSVPIFRFKRLRKPRPQGSGADVAHLRREWQRLVDHDCLACDEPAPDDPGCSAFHASSAAVNETAGRVTRTQERQVWRSLDIPRLNMRTLQRKWTGGWL